MKKLLKIVLLIVLLGVLIGAYFYLSKNPTDKTDKDKSAESETIEILKLDESKMTKIILNNEKGSFSFIKKDNNWVYEEKQDLKLDQNMLNRLVQNFTSLTAEKSVEKEAKDLDKYGLKNSKNTVTSFLKDGSSYTLELGDKTPEGSSYYLKLKNKNDIYTVSESVGDSIKYSINDLRSKELPAIDTSDIKYIKIVNLKGETIEIKANEAQNDNEKQYGINAFVMTKPYNNIHAVNSDKLNELNDSITKLSISDFISDSSKELSKYGLDKPRLEILAKDGKNELHLYFGKDVDNNNVAFKIAGAPEIYAMSKDSMEALNLNPFDLIDKFVYLTNIDLVNQINIENGSQKDIITLSRTVKKAEKEGEKDETLTTYKINGKEVSEEPFKNFYQKLIGLQVEAVNDKNLSEKPEVRIVYNLNSTNKKTTIVSFVEYNNDFYAVFVDGKSEFLISKIQVQNMLDEFNKLKK
jgi:hypothetical protein